MDFSRIRRILDKKENMFIAFLVLTVLVVLLIALWPVHFLALQNESDSNNGTSFKLNRNNPLRLTLNHGTDAISGIVFDVRSGIPVDQKTEFEFEVEADATKRTMKTKGLNGENSLYFFFPQIENLDGKNIQITLKAPNLPPENSLSILPPESGTELANLPVNFQLYETKPVFEVIKNTVYGKSAEGEDISYYWKRGTILAGGGNPYECALDNSCANSKMPIHFPLFYWLSSFSIKLGLAGFEAWLSFWRPVFILAYAGIGALLWFTLVRRSQYALALLTLLFWLLNRWSLYVIKVGHVDFLALFFLIASLVLIKRNLKISALLFGISLAIKQVAIFLIPLYLIYAWISSGRSSRKKWLQILATTVLIGIVPFLATLPFLFDQPLAMLKAIMFSATRSSESDFGAPALSAILNFHGTENVLPMLCLMALVYLNAWQKKIPIYISGLFVFAIFLTFNRVIFNQYFIWLIPFIPLAVSEIVLLTTGKRWHIDDSHENPPGNFPNH